MDQHTTGRIPIKLHKQVSLIVAEDEFLIEEILANKILSRYVVGRLSGTVILVSPDQSELILEELKRIGQSPRVIS